MALAATAELRRDAWVIGLVSTAHGVSHFFQLVLPPLFPLLKDVFGVSYQSLALLTALYYGTSGVAQPLAGFLVDHVGARRMLLLGLVVIAGATALMGFAPNFYLLFPLAILGGLGNSVFHPADFALLNAQVRSQRLGRAYGFHGIAGNIGWALAPVASLGLASVVGWRTGLVVLGVAGLGLAVLLALRNELHEQAHATRVREAQRGAGLMANLKLLLAAPIVMCFGFFTLLAISMVGLQTFEVPTTMMLYGVSSVVAATALTAFLISGSLGVLAGGVIADRARHHHRVAVTGLLLGATGAAILATGQVPTALIVPLLAVTGFCLGSTFPSRDLIVKQATPAGASGKVFGFVYSGLDFGSATIPILFGWLLDHQQPRWVFIVVVIAMLISTLTVLNMRARPRPSMAAAD